MKSSRYTAEQVAFAMRQAETGTPVPEELISKGVEIDDAGVRKGVSFQ
jgi:hypothetical protein